PARPAPWLLPRPARTTDATIDCAPRFDRLPDSSVHHAKRIRGRTGSRADRLVRHPVWNVAGRDVRRGRLDMARLVVEVDVGAERAQKLALVEATEKQRLVDPDVPRPQRADDPLMCRRTPRGDERRADRAPLLGELGLDPMQRGEEILERSAGERRRCRFALALAERGEPAGLIDALGLVGEQYRVAVEG